MKNQKQTLVLLTAVTILAFANSALAERLVIALRTNSADAKTVANAREARELLSTTREFDNGNTFVRFGETIVNDMIEVVVPSVMTSDDLMEALIKVRTARTDHALNVDIVTKGSRLSELSVVDPEGKPLNLPLKDLFLAAGAKGVRIGFDKASPVEALHASIIETNIEAPTKTVVLGELHPSLAKGLASKLGVELLDRVPSHDMHGVQVLLIVPPVNPHNASFFKGLSVTRELRSRGAMVNYITPYLPYARSDKKDQVGVTVIGRLAADLIETAGATSVTFMRAHAPQSQGFFSIPSTQSTGRPTITRFLEKHGVEVVVSPDAGFQKDATLYADELKVPVSVINKQRDPITAVSKIVGISGEPLEGKIVAIIDDETASGSTLGQAAQFLKEKEGVAKVIAVVTHLTGTAAKALSSPFIDEMAVTDSMPVAGADAKLTVLSTADELASDLAPLVLSKKKKTSESGAPAKCDALIEKSK